MTRIVEGASSGVYSQAQAAPERTAIVDPSGEAWSFEDLANRASRFANLLLSLDLKPGDVVATLLPNGHECLEICLATSQIGVYLTPINWHLTTDEVSYILRDSGAAVLVAHERFDSVAQAAASDAAIAEHARLSVGRIPGFHEYEASLASQAPDRPSTLRAGSTMLYTSGTTGRPKGVRRPLPDGSPDEIALRARQQCILFGLPLEGVHLATGPLYHGAPLGVAMSSLHTGRSVVLLDKFTPEKALDAIARHRVTDVQLVPTMIHRIMAMEEQARNGYDLTSLQAALHAAAPCPVGLKQRFMDWLGPIVWEFYGSTEGVATVAAPEEWLQHPGTVGKPVPGTELKICDESGQSLPPGDVGQVWIRSALTEFEYYNDPAKTSANRREGFITVGDVGYVDDDGFLFLCDRDADIIVSGGVNIYSAEIEATLIQHPDVADAAVIGVPNEEWGEEVKALVVVTEKAGPDEVFIAALFEYLQSQLARYKVPRSIELRENLPRNVESGKLFKRELRAEFWPAQPKAAAGPVSAARALFDLPGSQSSDRS